MQLFNTGPHKVSAEDLQLPYSVYSFVGIRTTGIKGACIKYSFASIVDLDSTGTAVSCKRKKRNAASTKYYILIYKRFQ